MFTRKQQVRLSDRNLPFTFSLANVSKRHCVNVALNRVYKFTKRKKKDNNTFSTIAMNIFSRGW